MNSIEQVRKMLHNVNQQQLLRFYDGLSDTEKADLLRSISEIDFQEIKDPKFHLDKGGECLYSPINVCDLKDIEQNKSIYERAGLQSLANGELGVLMLAGGEGTRLGFNKPKGMLNVGVNKPLFLFEILVNSVYQTVKKVDRFIPIFIMTNPRTHKDIVEFMTEHKFFGYNKEYIHLFPQSTLPSVDFHGKVLLQTPCHIAAAPDGNGNWYKAVKKNGIHHTIERYGIKWINVVSIDNVLQQIADPYFLGATITHKKHSGAKVVARAFSTEKVGIICLKNGQPSIIEYFEAENIMQEENNDGTLKYKYGVILNYLFEYDVLKSGTVDKMPVHLNKKKIPFCDNSCETIVPKAENGYKQETLLLDMVELIGSCLPYEVVREDEFAPIKNKTGVDSLELAQKKLAELGMLE